MNLVWDPIQQKLVRKWVHSTSPFQEVDDALYHHEQPYYRYCASGGGANPDEDLDWRSERDRLTALWQDKCPYTADVDPCAVRGTGLWQRFLSFFR